MIDKDKPDLKPCPFCGSVPYVVDNNGYDQAYVGCNCDAEPACSADAGSLDMAIVQWNKRANPPTVLDSDKDKSVEAQKHAEVLIKEFNWNYDTEYMEIVRTGLLPADQLRELFADRDKYRSLLQSAQSFLDDNVKELKVVLAERDEFESNVLYWQDQHEQEEKRRKEVEAECNRYKADAERYRFLKDNGGVDIDSDLYLVNKLPYRAGWRNDIDAFIDTQRGVK